MKIPAIQRAYSCTSRSDKPAAAPQRQAAVPSLGNQALQRLLLDRAVQAKFAISEPDDALEREAEETAETVMRMTDPAAPSNDHGESVRIQRQCTACGGAMQASGAKCPACEAKDRGVQRKAAGSGLSAAAASLVPGSGAPLPHPVRAFFEPRFRRDFRDVRVHANRDAVAAAQSLDALAYTAGRDIVFGAGQYAPGTTAGRRLLAHELAHVVQQTGAAQPVGANAMEGRFGAPAADAPRLSVAHAGGERVQRLVRRSLLNGCGAGQNPFTADRRASTLLTNAISRIDTAQAERAADPAHADVVAIGGAMHTAFRLDPANDDNWNLPAPRFGLPLIRRRLEIARNYIDSVVFTYNCCAVGGACPATCGTCEAGDSAFVCGGETSTITLCPLFFARNLNQRARSLVHEVLHINFGFIEDWEQPDRTNAHCYAHFTALVNGFNPPAGLRCH